MPFDPISVGLAGASLVGSLFGSKPDPNKAFRKMMGNTEFTTQYAGADQALQSSQDWYSRLLSGDPNVRRSLFAGTLYDLDRLGKAESGKLLRDPNMQRGGAMNLSLSNLSRDIFAQKAKAVTGKEEVAARGMLDVAQGRGNLFGQVSNAWQGAAQADLQAKQMGWGQMLQTGFGIGQALFGSGKGGGISWGQLGKLFGKGGLKPGDEGYGVLK